MSLGPGIFIHMSRMPVRGIGIEMLDTGQLDTSHQVGNAFARKAGWRSGYNFRFGRNTDKKVVAAPPLATGVVFMGIAAALITGFPPFRPHPTHVHLMCSKERLVTISNM